VRSVLLAAGFGTRLRPITDNLPKCLVPIHGKPLLGYWLDLLKPSTDNPVLINTHYLPERVNDFMSTSPWKNNCKIVHEAELLGTGGTVLQNQDFLRGEAFFLAHADNLTRFDLNAFIDAHRNRSHGIEITMMTFDTDSPQSCGIVETNQDNIVMAFHEKSLNPPGIRANAAVYIMEPSIIEFLVSLNKEIIDISTEVLPHYLNRMQIFHNANYHRDIGTPQSLQLAEMEF
jgi:mannose-1-phosphate guanylyltransferase